MVVAISPAVGFSTASGAVSSACSSPPSLPSLELVYSLHPEKERVTAPARERAAAIVCERLHELGVVTAEVRTSSRRSIRVLLPDPGAALGRKTASRLAEPGGLRFYDWEADLIGPEFAIGGRPGLQPKRSALRRAEGEWKAAGRSVRRASNLALLRSGAFPNAYGAVRLASKQPVREPCRRCSAGTTRFYAFDRSSRHRLIGGPTSSRRMLRRAHPRAILLGARVGTVVVSEQPSGRNGVLLKRTQPGWYALRDRPALTSADIVRPKQETDEFGRPNVTFGFTPKGRRAFARLTLAIALRGRAMATGKVTEAAAESFSGHMALVYDNEVKSRPIVHFLQNPRGIDGRTGAQISGGFDSPGDARGLAAILRVDPLPIELRLVRIERLSGV